MYETSRNMGAGPIAAHVELSFREKKAKRARMIASRTLM